MQQEHLQALTMHNPRQKPFPNEAQNDLSTESSVN